jgi:glycosyltransferase involved in cell wall biosynthesis
VRIALVTPTRLDPAHKRVSSCLAAAFRAQGHTVRLFPRAGQRFDAQAASNLNRALKNQRVDGVFIQYFSRGFSHLRRIRFPETTPLILTHQGASLKLLEHRALFSKLARRAQAITAVSRAGLSDFKKHYGAAAKKSHVIYNGVTTGEGTPARRMRPYMLTVGRLAAYKGLDVLALAFAQLTEDDPTLDWLAVGPDQTFGTFASYIKRLGLSQRVKLLGQRSAASVADLMRGCRVFAQPSRNENHPLAVLEAMAAGKPVVATRVGGIPEIIRHNKEGLLVAPGDLSGLTKALKQVTHNAPLRHLLGKAGRKRAKTFSWENAARNYLRLMRRAIG